MKTNEDYKIEIKSTKDTLMDVGLTEDEALDLMEEYDIEDCEE